MATTTDMIREWLEEGKKEKATHVIIVCDTFDWEDFPINVSQDEDVKKRWQNIIKVKRCKK